MHCPSCGDETPLDQKFCRKCGMNLESIGQLVAEHAAPESLTPQKREHDKTMLRQMYRWMIWGFLVLLIGLVLIVTNKQLALGRFVNLIGSILLLAGTAIATYGVLAPFRASFSKQIKGGNRPELPLTKPTDELPDARTPIPITGITERTTELLVSSEAEKSAE